MRVQMWEDKEKLEISLYCVYDDAFVICDGLL